MFIVRTSIDRFVSSKDKKKDNCHPKIVIFTAITIAILIKVFELL